MLKKEPLVEAQRAKGRTGRTTADFEQVVVSNAHHLFTTVDNDSGLFDDAARADDDRPSESKDGSLGMNDRAWSDGDIAFEIDILTDDCFRMDRKLVPSKMTKVTLTGSIWLSMCSLTWVA